MTIFWLWFFAACFAGAALLTPLVMRLARRLNAVDSGGYRKITRGSIPLLGGLSIALPVLAACGISVLLGFFSIYNWQWVNEHFPSWFHFLMSLASSRSDFLVLTIGGFLIVVLGMIDDIFGLRARYKLLGQILVAFVLCAGGFTLRSLSLPIIGYISLPGLAGYAIAMFWIVGLINAMNLIDGIDGLAAGTACIIALGLGILALSDANLMVMLVCIALAGSALGFLIFNFNPARIFLGDTGSMFLGLMLAGATLIGAQKTSAATIVLAPILALGFPIAETFISMLRRFARGKPIFSADQHHTHHRLLRKGYTQRQTVALLYGVTFLCTAAAIVSQMSGTYLLPILLYLATLAAIAWLAGYLRPESLRALNTRRARNARLMTFARYAVASLLAHKNRDHWNQVMDLARVEIGLRFLAAWDREDESTVFAVGTAEPEDPNRVGLTEKMHVRTPAGRHLILSLQFAEKPPADLITDAGACLAFIFEKVEP